MSILRPFASEVSVVVGGAIVVAVVVADTVVAGKSAPIIQPSSLRHTVL